MNDWFAMDRRVVPDRCPEVRARGVREGGVEKYSSAATGVDVDASGVEFWRAKAPRGCTGIKMKNCASYGVWVTPHLATVTYVEVEDADGAAPTVVFEGLTPRSRPDAEDAKEDETRANAGRVMYPREWAHFTLDGRFLPHGALDAFAKKPRDDDGARGRRVALLANVWFNHKPLGVERLPESYVEENFCDVAFDDDAKEMTIHRIARSDFGARRLGKCSVFGPMSSEYALANAELPLDALRAIAPTTKTVR